MSDGDFIQPRDAAPTSAAGSGASVASLANDLVRWRNVTRSSIVFGAGNAFFFLLNSYGYSFVQLVAYIALLLLVAATLLAFAQDLMGRQSAAQGRRSFAPQVVLTEEAVRAFVPSFVLMVNTAVNFVRLLLSATDIRFNGKVAGALVGAAIVGRIFTTLTLLHVVFVVSFVWPVAYAKYHREIDMAAALALEQAKIGLRTVQALIPRADQYTTRPHPRSE